MKRYIIRVTGKVHGAGFRITASDKAEDLGLFGFTRNDPDGAVYIDVEGNEPALDEFIAWCAHGPQSARVAEVTAQAQSEIRNYKKFVIL